MKKTMKAFRFIYFFVCFFILLGNTSFAYIDPSAVTYVIQAVAGAACTVYRHKIMKFFRTWKKKRARKKHQSAEQE